MTVTFHNKEPRIFNSLHRACVDAGFIPEKVLYQANKRAGETGVSTPWGTSISDFYIRFRKPKNSELNLEQFMQPDESKFERFVVSSAKEVLSSRILSYLDESKRIDNSRMQEWLGVIPKFPDLNRGLEPSESL